MDKEFLALEAARLVKDPVFNEALRLIRTEAVEKLLKTPADDMSNVMSLQTLAKVCDQLPEILGNMIKAVEKTKPLQVV